MTGVRAIFARVDRWSDWKRSWLITLVVGCWVLVFLSIWVLYASTHLNPRYTPSGPGAAVTLEHQTYRALGIRQTEAIIDGEDLSPSGANAVWVVVDLEITIDRKLEFVSCDLPLVAVGNRTWTAETFYSREVPAWCDSEEFTVGKPYPIQLIYQVPVKYAGKIFGVAVVDHSSPAPSIVLQP